MRTDWISGYHAVLAALEGGRAVEVVWLLQGRRDSRLQKVRAVAGKRGIPVKLVARSRLDACAPGVVHNGCAARCAPVALRSVDELVAGEARPGRLLLLDDITDPHNLGAAIRSAATFNVDGVVIAGPSPPPLGGAVAKAAAGQLERVPIARVNVAGDVLVELRGAGYWVLGADAAGEPIDRVRPVERWVLCVGSEARGLRSKTRSQVDELVAIPMATGVESLNVSVATGILLYELCGRGVR